MNEMEELREGYERLVRCGGVGDLSSRVEVLVTGADRVRYLNGQVTSDVKKLGIWGSGPACLTTAKGRMCAEVMVTKGEEGIYVDGEEGLGGTLLERLGRYIIADDVNLEEVAVGRRLLHYLGEEPVEMGGVRKVRVNRFGREGWDVRISAEDFERNEEGYFPKSKRVDARILEILRVEAGIPRWGYELGEETLPPEAGLDRTHIDYHKGCYVGQETISRLKSVGHVNRELRGMVWEGGGIPEIGGLIFGEGGERAGGVVTSVAYSFALEKWIALGYVKRGISAGQVCIRPASGEGEEVRMAVHALPFVVL